MAGVDTLQANFYNSTDMAINPSASQEQGIDRALIANNPEMLELVDLTDFSNPAAAMRCLERLFFLQKTPQQVAERMCNATVDYLSAEGVLAELLNALSTAADPDRALIDFERFFQSIDHATARTGNTECLNIIRENPRSIEILVTLFAGSQFLTEILLRNPEYLNYLLDKKLLAVTKSTDEYRAEVEDNLEQTQSLPEQLDQLRRYQRQELLRIGYCDLLDYLDLPTVIQQLSNLADALVQVSLRIASSISGKTGNPVSSDGFAVTGFAVIALGKLGGQELNYSSDIDLLFLCRAGGADYRRLGESLIETLARITAEGFLYRVDMRLRPWGKDGSLVSSVDAYLAYLSRHARQWEKQALLKSRFIAGDIEVARDFFTRSLPLLFNVPIEAVRHDVHAMKLRTEAFLEEKGRNWGEVKLGAGSIRDVEFIVQYLQLAHGAQRPDILTANTLLALKLLKEQKLLRPEEQRVLVDGYIFFRTVEHYLQMMHYQQVSTLPRDEKELSLLARRLGFEGKTAGSLLVQRFNQHSKATRQVYNSHLGGRHLNGRHLVDRHLGDDLMETDQPKAGEEGNDATPFTDPDSNADIHLHQHLTRMDPSYRTTFTPEEIAHHAGLIQKLSDERLVIIDPKPSDQQQGEWVVTIVAHDYPGELSMICGMLYVYGINIESGFVFTYEPVEENAPKDSRDSGFNTSSGRSTSDQQKKIVDVFRVHMASPDDTGATGADNIDTVTTSTFALPTVPLWEQYSEDLEQLLRLMQSGERREARNRLTRRVALKLSQESSPEIPPLYPIEVTFDNTISDRYTVLRITSQDTIGFLYELTNALALYQIYIALVQVESSGNRIHDTLFVTGADGNKIIDPERQNELRSAILLIKHFTHLLPHSANPESALLHFRGFIEKLQQQPGWFDEVAAMERPEVLHALAEVLGVSDFLWEDFLRMQYENLYPVVRDIEQLSEPKSKKELEQELEACLVEPCVDFVDPIYGTGWRSTVNAFKDRELFRVDMRNILGYTDAFDQFSLELTELAEVIINTTVRLCEEELIEQFGKPIQEDGTSCQMTICALGKCGGWELGFASDIELIFVYSGNGHTDGEKTILAAEYYEKLVQNFLGAIRTRREGIFHIDLQLRPYGKAGSLAVSLPSFRNYFNPQGAAWAYERQALVRLRPIGGDAALGAQVSNLRDEFVYTGEPFDGTSMRAMRERQVRHIVSGGTFNAKYSPGGLLDIEYLIQGLQINHGLEHPEVRSPNTRAAMTALAEVGVIPGEDYDRLRRALTFLRWLINTLRVVRGNAKDLTVPPYGSLEFEYLTRRLRYGNDIERLRDELARFTGDVVEINQKLLA